MVLNSLAEDASWLCSRGVLKRGLQIWFSFSLASKLVVLLLSRIIIDSSAFLLVVCSSCILTLADSQSPLCPLSYARTAIQFFSSRLQTTYWCSFNLILRFLPVSPRLSNADAVVVRTGYFVHYTFLLVFWNLRLDSHEQLS